MSNEQMDESDRGELQVVLERLETLDYSPLQLYIEGDGEESFSNDLGLVISVLKLFLEKDRAGALE